MKKENYYTNTNRCIISDSDNSVCRPDSKRKRAA